MEEGEQGLEKSTYKLFSTYFAPRACPNKFLLLLFRLVEQIKQPDVVKMVREGNLEGLKEISLYMEEALHAPDDLGWTVLHEATRRGHLDIVQFLINEHSVDKDLITETGVSPLNIARQFLGNEHPLSKYLELVGAIDAHPYRKPSSSTSANPSSGAKAGDGDEL